MYHWKDIRLHSNIISAICFNINHTYLLMASLIRYQIEWLLCLFGVEDIIDIIPRQDCSKIIPKSADHFISIITQFMRRLLPEQEIIIDVEMLNIFSLYCSPSQIAQSIGLFFSIKTIHDWCNCLGRLFETRAVKYSISLRLMVVCKCMFYEKLLFK